MKIKVIATKFGFYGGARKRKDTEFYILSEDDFSSKWMTHAKDQTPEAVQQIIKTANKRRWFDGFIKSNRLKSIDYSE